MKIIVIGGNGFLGSNFVERAHADGHEIIIVDPAPFPRQPRTFDVEYIAGSIEDLVNAPDRLACADIIYNFAYSTVPASSAADPEKDLRDNLFPLLRLLQAMVHVGTKRIVYLSSGGAVYGAPNVSKISEEIIPAPLSTYGASKLAAEKYLGVWAANYGIIPTIIRPSNPYGLGQTGGGILGAITTFCQAAKAGRPITIWGDGSTIRDFIHVDDVSSLLLNVLNENCYNVFNCGSGLGYSLNDIISLVNQISGTTLDVLYEARRSFDPPRIVLDISKAQNFLAWMPQVPIEEGIKQLIFTNVFSNKM